MAQTHCKKHPDQELVEVTIRYCPVCRGSKGGLQTASRMTAKARKERAQKAIAARWGKEGNRSK
jgi:hypothetical protein